MKTVDCMLEFKTIKENANGMWVYQYLGFARESNEVLWEGEVIKVIFKGLVDCSISLFMVQMYFVMKMLRSSELCICKIHIIQFLY